MRKTPAVTVGCGDKGPPEPLSQSLINGNVCQSMAFTVLKRSPFIYSVLLLFFCCTEKRDSHLSCTTQLRHLQGSGSYWRIFRHETDV